MAWFQQGKHTAGAQFYQVLSYAVWHVNTSYCSHADTLHAYSLHDVHIMTSEDFQQGPAEVYLY